MMNYDRYWQAVQRKVCNHCIDQGEDGNCALTGENKKVQPFFTQKHQHFFQTTNYTINLCLARTLILFLDQSCNLLYSGIVLVIIFFEIR